MFVNAIANITHTHTHTHTSHHRPTVQAALSRCTLRRSCVYVCFFFFFFFFFLKLVCCSIDRSIGSCKQLGASDLSLGSSKARLINSLYRFDCLINSSVRFDYYCDRSNLVGDGVACAIYSDLTKCYHVCVLCIPDRFVN